MLTIFSAPKAFRGHFGIIQDNAIRSWKRLTPAPTIVLFGDDGGVAEAAVRLGVRHVTSIATNAHGTPLVSDMFRQADQLAAGSILAFVSADVILTQSLVEAAQIVSAWSEHFLLVARRHDVDVRDSLDFDDIGWARRFDSLIAGGRLHSEGGIDLFMYRRGQYADMPPFAIGRTSYDNWLLWHTVAVHTPLIDATDFVTLLHQDHDYSHARGVDVWKGVEARENQRWLEHWSHSYTIFHANWVLDRDGNIAPATAWRYRFARPKRALSRAFRVTRPWRERLQNRTRPSRSYGS